MLLIKQNKPVLRLLLLINIMVLLVYMPAHAQVKPPSAMSVSNIQSLNFGIFSQSDDLGGTVTFSSTGVRSATGNVSIIGSSGYYAIFTVTTDIGSQIVLLNGSYFTLTGSNGGSMTLHIGAAYPTCPYTTTTATTQMQIGGTLVVGSRAANPPGAYSGTFSVTFNNE